VQWQSIYNMFWLLLVIVNIGKPLYYYEDDGYQRMLPSTDTYMIRPRETSEMCPSLPIDAMVGLLFAAIQTTIDSPLLARKYHVVRIILTCGREKYDMGVLNEAITMFAIGMQVDDHEKLIDDGVFKVLNVRILKKRIRAEEEILGMCNMLNVQLDATVRVQRYIQTLDRISVLYTEWFTVWADVFDDVNKFLEIGPYTEYMGAYTYAMQVDHRAILVSLYKLGFFMSMANDVHHRHMTHDNLLNDIGGPGELSLFASAVKKGNLEALAFTLNTCILQYDMSISGETIAGLLVITTNILSKSPGPPPRTAYARRVSAIHAMFSILQKILPVRGLPYPEGYGLLTLTRDEVLPIKNNPDAMVLFFVATVKRTPLPHEAVHTLLELAPWDLRPELRRAEAYVRRQRKPRTELEAELDQKLIDRLQEAMPGLPRYPSQFESHTAIRQRRSQGSTGSKIPDPIGPRI
jgi:hypothetical protein